LYDWLAQSIDGVIFRSDITNSYCCTTGPAGTGQYLNIVASANWSAFVTNLWINEKHNGLSTLLALFIHEARHANGYPHTCPDGASDSTYEELGAWAAQYSFYRWLAFHSDPCFMRPTLAPDAQYFEQLSDPTAYMSASRDEADHLSQVRFCQSPPPVADPPDPVAVCAP
jgi:hypothetical protein